MLLRLSDATQLTISTSEPPLQVKLPDGSLITSLYTGTFYLPALPTPLSAHVFPDNVLDTLLISISELCNLGCVATFVRTGCTITYCDKLVLQCSKLCTDKLRHFSFSLPLPPPSANATMLLSSDRAFIHFAHASLGSPFLSTLLNAVRLGYLHHWPSLTVQPLRTFLPQS